MEKKEMPFKEYSLENIRAPEKKETNMHCKSIYIKFLNK